MTEFDQFWLACPRKVGKLAAQKAYGHARKSGATQAALLSGLAAYVRHKPAYAEYCHPTTWLRQGRWMDEYDAPALPPGEDWFEECKQLHGGACGLSRYAHGLRMHVEAVAAAAKGKGPRR